jgi:transcriptional antiterminator RfaH
MLHWYVIHTKPRQEQRAFENLGTQGYNCYLPIVSVQKVTRGKVSTQLEPLFARYLFIELDATESGKSWSPIRSTLGVSKLVTFGTEPAKVSADLIAVVRQHTEASLSEPISLYQQGDRVQITEGPFAGIEAVFEKADGEVRAMVLIELLSKPTRLKLPLVSLLKAG